MIDARNGSTSPSASSSDDAFLSALSAPPANPSIASSAESSDSASRSAENGVRVPLLLVVLVVRTTPYTRQTTDAGTFV